QVAELQFNTGVGHDLGVRRGLKGESGDGDCLVAKALDLAAHGEPMVVSDDDLYRGEDACIRGWRIRYDFDRGDYADPGANDEVFKTHRATEFAYDFRLRCYEHAMSEYHDAGIADGLDDTG